jgi:hypothetical protein
LNPLLLLSDPLRGLVLLEIVELILIILGTVVEFGCGTGRGFVGEVELVVIV